MDKYYKKTMSEIEIRGHHLNYEDGDKEAMRYLLERLDDKEHETLFEYARHYRESYFQDQFQHHFILQYRDGQYYITKR
jgi:biotin synthase-like enzyme